MGGTIKICTDYIFPKQMKKLKIRNDNYKSLDIYISIFFYLPYLLPILTALKHRFDILTSGCTKVRV
jgi:hypothetical protein